MGVRYRDMDIVPLEKSIRSILNQTYANIEFLICQSDSTEAACQLLKQLAAEDNRIRLISGDGTQRLTQKLNRCLKEAKGAWIARMDDDDYSYPKRFELQIEYMKEHPDCVAVGSWVREVGGLKTESIRKLLPVPTVRDFRITFPFIHPALMFRHEALSLVGGYSEKAVQEGCDDYDLLLRLYSRGYSGANIQAVLLDYSIVNSQLKRRPYRLFVNEFITRTERFYELQLLPGWCIWVLKPLVTGLIPRRLLYYIKSIS